MSTLTDAAERGIARARFSSLGRRYIGPRLPRRQSFDDAARSPELMYALFVSAKTFARVLDAYGAIPPGTLAIVAANVAVFSLPDGVAFGDVCLNPYAVIHLAQLERLVTSAFVHVDAFHLLSNMQGVLQDGSFLESLDGTPRFLARCATLLGLSQCTLVGLSWAERRFYQRGSSASRRADAWLDDAVDRVSKYAYGGNSPGYHVPIRGTSSSSSAPKLLPFYNSGVVGFSGVNFALKVAAAHRRPANSVVLVGGLVPCPARYSAWFELALGTLIVPSAGTFAAHFAGTIAGLISVYAPRMSGFGVLGSSFSGGRNRAYRGRGHRLGGRYLRDDDPGAGGAGGGGRNGRNGRNGRDGRGDDSSPAGATRGSAGRRLGGGDPSNGRNGRNGRNWFARAWGVACAPFARLKVAVDEGAPLVVHGAFALACLVLQRTMARNCPEGLLRRVSIPPIVVPFSLGG